MSSWQPVVARLSKRHIASGALLVLLAIAGIVLTRNLIDFPVYYSAGQSLLDGRTDLYAGDFARGQVMDYRYPPFFLVVLVPLWMLPYSVAAYLWYIASILEIAGCVWVLSGLVGRVETPARLWVISALVVAQYFVMVLHYGNAHTLVVFLMFASSYLVFRQKDFSAALLISLAITIKLAPALLLPYFALKRKWKFLSLVGLLVVALNLAPAAYFGLSKNSDLLRVWYAHVVADQEFHEINGPINLSLKGQLRRYLTQIDYTQRVDGDIRYPAVNLTSLTASQSDKLWMVLAATAFSSGLALIWWLSRRKVGERREPPNDGEQSSLMSLEVGLVICLMLLAGPLTSKIYFIALLWPVAALVRFAFASQSPARRFAWYALIFAVVTNSVLPLLPGRVIQRLLLVLGVDFYVNLLVTAAVGFALFSSARLPEARSGERQTEVPSEARTS